MNKTNQKDHNHTSLYFIVGNSILAITILSIVGYLSYLNRKQIFRETTESVHHQSLIVEEAVKSSLGAIEIVLDQIAHEVEKKDSATQLSQSDLGQFKIQIKKIKSLNLNWADADGNLQWNSEADPKKFQPKKINISEREYFNYLKNNKTKQVFVTEPLFGKIRKDWVIVIAKGLRSKEGKFLGVAWCSVSADYFMDLKSLINIKGEDLFGVATGGQPKYFYRYPTIKDIVGKKLIGAKEAQDVVKNKQHRGVYEATSVVDGRRRISAYSWVGELPVFIVVGQDIENVLSSWRMQTITMFILSFFGILMSVALSIYFFKSNQSYRYYQMQLVKSSKLVALGEMSGSVAHEINNPLQIINGHIEKMNRTLSQHSGDLKELEYSLGKIKVNSTRISNIVLGLRKINNRSELRFSNTALRMIVDEAAGMATERFRASGIKLIVECNDDGALVNVNETQILQVLVNLLNNSFDEVQLLKDPWVKVSTRAEKGHVHVYVTDSGGGIPSEIAKSIMSPFFTTKGIGKGTGLGLSISKEIIEIHGGRLWYNSSSANTQFVIELPLSRKREIKLSA